MSWNISPKNLADNVIKREAVGNDREVTYYKYYKTLLSYNFFWREKEVINKIILIIKIYDRKK